MNSKLTKPLAGLLIPSILLPSCTPSFLFHDETIEEINKKRVEPVSALPLDINSERFQNLITCFSKLVKDVIENPEIAERCVSDRISLFAEYGIDAQNLEYNREFEQVLLVLSDKDVHDAILTQDPDEILKVCKEKGLIKGLTDDELNIASSDELRVMAGFVAGAVVFVIAIAGIVAVAADGVAVYDTYAFWADKVRTNFMQERNMDIYTACTIKLPPEKTYVVSSRYVELSVKQMMDLVEKHYPGLTKNVDEEQLVQIMSYNMTNKQL